VLTDRHIGVLQLQLVALLELSVSFLFDSPLLLLFKVVVKNSATRFSERVVGLVARRSQRNTRLLVLIAHRVVVVSELRLHYGRERNFVWV